MMRNKLIGFSSLLSIGILFGLSGVIAKYLSQWLNPYQVVQYRFATAFILALIILFLTRQTFSISNTGKTNLLAFSVTFPLSVIFFTLAIFNTSVPIAVFSFYISTLVTSFIVGMVFFGEEINLNKKIALVMILIAVLYFTNPFQSKFVLDLGFIFGIISGVFQTIASAFQKIVGKSTNRISLLITQTFTGLIMGMIANILSSGKIFVPITQTTLLVIIFFGIIFLLISYLFLVGFKYIDLNVGSILVSSELFFGPFFAFIFLKQHMTTYEIIGGLFVAGAVFYSNKKSKQN